ncbi:MAG TPA: TlpA disulfide reductase family protein [Polyangiaceae bacterium]|nr:TlpA disulfide reductase family protein [Polyangiaceae bacterium]
MKQLAQLGQTAFIFVAAVAVYSFVSAARDGERRRVCGPLCHLRPNYAARNRTAPDFDLPRVEQHGRVKLSSYRGKTVVLNFWTKNCRPCLEEMPSLAELTSSLKGDPDVVVLTVSTDETIEDVRGTLRSVVGGDVPFVTAIDPESSVVADKYGTKLYPETWIIDPKGVIRARFDGARDWTSPLVHDLLREIRSPLACSADFENGRPTGEDAPTCEDIAG